MTDILKSIKALREMRAEKLRLEIALTKTENEKEELEKSMDKTADDMANLLRQDLGLDLLDKVLWRLRDRARCRDCPLKK